MSDTPSARPDLTLTLDCEGVIQHAIPAEALAQERLEGWRGRSWAEMTDPAISRQIRKMIDDMRHGGASSCFQTTQTFPSGCELEIEYTAISLGKEAGFIAIGRNLRTISDLQARLLLAQQAREQDYWKIREIETRYRMLFDASNEAVVLARVSDLKIIEANLTAANSLGLLTGAEFSPQMSERDRKAFEAMLEKVRLQGRAPGIVLHLSAPQAQWSIRASMMNSEAGALYLFQISQLKGPPARGLKSDPFSAQTIVQRFPDGFAIVDSEGIVRRVNNAFLEMTQIGSESAMLGQKISRWLSRPGADISVVMNMVRKHGSVRGLVTTIEGEFGVNAEVEISAAGDKPHHPDYIGLLVRDVTSRGQGVAIQIASHAPDDFIETRFDNFPLDQIVKASTEAIERKRIAEALESCGGNRTAAARRLGLSRQSLHAKLNKYNLEEK